MKMYMHTVLLQGLLFFATSIQLVGFGMVISSLYTVYSYAACPCQSCRELVDIQKINPNIQVDLRYATLDNFTEHVVYDFNRCILLRCVAEALDKVQKELEPMDLGLKIWDGLRPMSAQDTFWELVPDERYVSNPAKGGGRHTRGTAVDLTLVRLSDGQEVEMPTLFDDFTERAHSDYMDCSEEAIKNRQILHDVMIKHGFVQLQTEWWHFDFQNWEKFPVVSEADMQQALQMNEK